MRDLGRESQKGNGTVESAMIGSRSPCVGKKSNGDKKGESARSFENDTDQRFKPHSNNHRDTNACSTRSTPIVVNATNSETPNLSSLFLCRDKHGKTEEQ